MVEIIVHPWKDTITMSIESAPAIMDAQLAMKVIGNWSEIVRGCWENVSKATDKVTSTQLLTI